MIATDYKTVCYTVRVPLNNFEALPRAVLAGAAVVAAVAMLSLPHAAHAAPLFIQEVETTWTCSVSTTRTTPSFNVQAGDVLVAYSVGANFDSGDGKYNEPTTVSGGSLTWTNRQTVQANHFAWIGVWTATVDADKAMTSRLPMAMPTMPAAQCTAARSLAALSSPSAARRASARRQRPMSIY